MDKARNTIQTWAPGTFVNRTGTAYLLKYEIAMHARVVRPYPGGPGICTCPTPEDAKWIAERLNLAAKLEQLLGTQQEGT